MIGLLMLLEVGTGNSFYERGNDLLALCQRDRGACAMYVAGSSDQLQLMQMSFKRYGACPGDHVTIGQATDVVLKYMGDHPEERDEGAAFVIAMALKQAFPCAPPK